MVYVHMVSMALARQMGAQSVAEQMGAAVVRANLEGVKSATSAV